jgi:hypothetical protein
MNIETLPEGSPAGSGLRHLSMELSLDNITRTEAERLYNLYVTRNSSLSSAQEERGMRCAILAASYTASVKTVSGEELPCNPISIAQLLKGSEAHSTVVELKNFLNIVPLPDASRQKIQEIVAKFAFSLSFFQKYENLWDSLKIEGRDESVGLLKEAGWLLFILARSELLQKNMDLVENVYVLLGSLEFLIINAPSNLNSAVPKENALQFLAASLNSPEDKVQSASRKIAQYVQNLKASGEIRGNYEESMEGIFSLCHLNYNLRQFSLQYQRILTPDSIDERDFLGRAYKIGTPIKNKQPITPYMRQAMTFTTSKKLTSQRMLDWQDDVSLSSNLKDLKKAPPASPFIPPSTPMTTAMEMNRWIQTLIEEESGFEPRLKALCGSDAIYNEICSRLETNLEKLQSVFSTHGIGTVKVESSRFLFANFSEETVDNSSKSNSKIETLREIYWTALIRLLENEEKRMAGGNLQTILCNEEFQMSLVACCVETLLYTQNITSLSFMEILNVLGVSVFSFWKIINGFAQFDVRMPLPLRRHLREIEVKILNNLGWESGSPVLRVVQDYAHGGESKDGACDMFFRRVLSLSAHRVLELGEQLKLGDSVKELIWQTVKHALSEHTELLMDRHLDQVILCTVYGVSKLQGPISFKGLVELYYSMYPAEETLFSQVKLPSGTGDIIQFYNRVYLPKMKSFLTGNVSRFTPRIAALSPASPLRANLPAPLHYASLASPMRSPLSSPFLTPRTRKLWAKDSPSISSSRRICFEGEDANPCPKYFDMIVNTSEDPHMPMPTIRKA